MEQTPPSSRRMLLVGIAAIVGLIVIITAVTFALFGSSKRETPSAASQDTTNKVASKEEIDQNLKDLSSTIKQASADQSSAKAVLKEDADQMEADN